MKRRTFLTNLAATAAVPMMPMKALASVAPTAAAASMDQPYLWASFITRVHNNASPAMLQRLLKLDKSMASRVYSELVKNNVVTPPNAYGISRAVNPFPQPGMAHMQGASNVGWWNQYTITLAIAAGREIVRLFPFSVQVLFDAMWIKTAIHGRVLYPFCSVLFDSVVVAGGASPSFSRK